MIRNQKVSVIIPVYNMSVYLKECIDSVLEQSLQEFEVICIDDGSTDDSLHILEEYAMTDRRVKIIKKENGGYGNTVNLGISQAMGEYISIVEPDDYIEQKMLETLYDAAQKYGLDIVSADYKFFYDDAGKRVFEKHFVYDEMDLYDKVLKPGANTRALRGQFINPASLFRREFLLKHGITHNETPGAAFQDRGFCFLSMIQAERIMVLPQGFYNYRQDNPSSSIAGRDDVDKVITEYRLVLKKLLNMGDGYRKFLSEHFRREYESCRYALSRSREDVQKDTLYKLSEEFKGYENRGILDISGMQIELSDELQLIMSAPQEVYRSLSGLKNEIHEKISDFDNFVIYGAGVVGKRILQGLSIEDKEKCLGFAVSDVRNNVFSFDGYSIQCISEYMDKINETAVIVAVTQKYRNEIVKTLSELGFQNVIVPKSIGADI